jgi:AcrR family transcriptional regulator
MCTHTRREEQRGRILEAAYELVAEVGISGLRTREIASRAGVNVAMLHYCFENKDGLLKALYEHIIEKVRAEMCDEKFRKIHDSGNIRDFAHIKIAYSREGSVPSKAWRAFCAGIWTHKAIQEVMESHVNEVRKRFASVIEVAREKGNFNAPASCDNEFIASIFMSVMDGLFFQWAASGEKFPIDEYLDQFADWVGLLKSEEDLENKV